MAGLEDEPLADEPRGWQPPEPWPEPVDGARLLDDLEATFLRYVSLPAGAAPALALWALYTWAYEAFDVSPRLVVTSPTKRCGKTRLLSLLEALVRQPVSASNLTAASLCQLVDALRPTVLVDEYDTFVRGNDPLRGIINSGHTRTSAFIIRCSRRGGAPLRLSTWAPLALAGIGAVPDTIADRAVMVPLQRRSSGERFERLRLSSIAGDLAPLRRRSLRWAKDHLASLRERVSPPVGALDDRAEDNWQPLLAVADEAGGGWYRKARVVARQLSGGRDADDETPGIELLADLDRLFGARGDRLATNEVLEGLARMDERSWPGYHRGRPINAREVARLLRPFGIRPRLFRDAGGIVTRGYLQGDLQEPLKRYVERHGPR